MKDAFSYVVSSAQRQGFEVKVIRDEAINIEKIEEDQIYVITKKNNVILANKVVLACGTQKQSEMILPYSKGIIARNLPEDIGSL